MKINLSNFCVDNKYNFKIMLGWYKIKKRYSLREIISKNINDDINYRKILPDKKLKLILELTQKIEIVKPLVKKYSKDNSLSPREKSKKIYDLTNEMPNFAKEISLGKNTGIKNFFYEIISYEFIKKDDLKIIIKNKDTVENGEYFRIQSEEIYSGYENLINDNNIKLKKDQEMLKKIINEKIKNSIVNKKTLIIEEYFKIQKINFEKEVDQLKKDSK